MGRTENEAVARGLGEAFQAQDMQAMDALIADDIIWHQIGAPDIRGKDAMRASAASIDYEITARPIDLLASDDHAIALGEATATRAGQTFTYRTAEIYRIVNGRIAERWAYSDDTEAIARFFA